MAVVFLLLVATQIVYFQLSAADGRVLGYTSSVSASKIVELTNHQRQQQGVQPLDNNPDLKFAAQLKADDMAQRGYWSHFTPEGAPPWAFIEQAGYEYEFAGENLAMDFDTSDGVVAGWMASASHRDNLLDRQYHDIGVALANGMIEGRQTTVVVALYGSPIQPTSNQIFAGDVFSAGEQPRDFSLIRPVSLWAALSWPAKVSITLLGAIALIMLLQHLVIKRRHLRWDKHAHTHPLLTSAIVMAAIVAIISSGLGSVL
jgi:hypothetical protein